MRTPFFEVEELSKSYGGLRAVSEVSFQIGRDDAIHDRRPVCRIVDCPGGIHQGRVAGHEGGPKVHGILEEGRIVVAYFCPCLAGSSHLCDVTQVAPGNLGAHIVHVLAH